jgi:hypothetical protein
LVGEVRQQVIGRKLLQDEVLSHLDILVFSNLHLLLAVVSVVAVALNDLLLLVGGSPVHYIHDGKMNPVG